MAVPTRRISEQKQGQSRAPELLWFELAIGACTIVLLLQFFPGAWSALASMSGAVLSYGDVRGWTWRSYAVVWVAAIAVLIVVKGRQDSV